MWAAVSDGTAGIAAARLANFERYEAAQAPRGYVETIPPEPRPAARVRALRSFRDGINGDVVEGEVYATDHPSVTQNPEGFEPVAEDSAG
jgi:hypothetical protein